MRVLNISSRNILQSAALMMGVSLLFASGCAVPIKAQALDQVKTVAVVGVTQVNNMQGPQSPGGQGVTGMVNAVKSMQKADSGQADAERRARTEGSHSLLSQKLQDNVGWKALGKDELGSNEKYRSLVASQTNTVATTDTGALLREGARLNLRDMAARTAVLDALGVDAVATSMVTYDVGKTSGFAIGGMGAQKRHPRATVRFVVYDRNNPEPIWTEYSATGSAASEGIQDIMGVTSTADHTPIFLSADGSAYDKVFVNYKSYRERAAKQAAADAAKNPAPAAAPAPAPAPAPEAAPAPAPEAAPAAPAAPAAQ